MLNKLSASVVEQIIDYHISDGNLPFSKYLAACRAMIEERRTDLHQTDTKTRLILNANSPFECYPTNPILSDKRIKYGVLLLHGLLDCPFSLRDIGAHLQENGLLCRSILLPGHGTQPGDLLSITYHDWIQAVRYGIDSLRKEVDKVYLVGYSTGAALSIYQALQDAQISGIILLAPAIRIKVPMNLVVSWRYLKKWMHINHNQWIYKVEEIDYAKYLSISFNAVNQVAALTDVLRDLSQQHSLTCPMFLAVSKEDETISSHKAIHFFSRFHNPDSKLLLYASDNRTYSDPRIIVRRTNYPELNIKNFSHVSIPFAPRNSHYGQQGDYEYASHIDKQFAYGAYFRVQSIISEELYKLKCIKMPCRQLTYNPDFYYMAEQITNFIQSVR